MSGRIGQCETRGCTQPAIAFNDDGVALCEDHIEQWMIEEVEGPRTSRESEHG